MTFSDSYLADSHWRLLCQTWPVSMANKQLDYVCAGCCKLCLLLRSCI